MGNLLLGEGGGLQIFPVTGRGARSPVWMGDLPFSSSF